MTKFLKLTRQGTTEKMLVNIGAIRQIVETSCGGARLIFSDDPKHGRMVVEESVGDIAAMILNEEVVK